MKTFFDGDEVTFSTMKQKYGGWPMTVWDCDYGDRVMQAVKKKIGDDGGPMNVTAGVPSPRKGCLDDRPEARDSIYGGTITASVFNPAVAQMVLNFYAPEGGMCFDPFGGGGTRGIVAVKSGLRYCGVEIRSEEVDAVRRRAERCGITEGMVMFCGDAADCSEFMGDSSADFCFTCPPYWNLEKYGGGQGDLSMCRTYQDFLGGLGGVVNETFRILRPGSYSCWVVGLHRDTKGGLLAMHHDVARLHLDCGFVFKEEVVLNLRGTGALRRVGNFGRGNQYLVRTHEYLLVFRKPEV